VCGIAGCIAAPGARPDRDVLERMVGALRHRGPDDRGVEVVGQVGLGVARLAIVDPSPAGHQPMRGDSGEWWLAYNGEVFNHPDLRRALGAREWRGGSDTETVLAALEAWGEDALGRCNGLFAWAALDGAGRRVLLARDRFGVKPLYMARHAGAVWFASEVRALLAAGVPARPRTDVLAHAVAYGWAECAATPLEGIHRVAPGTLVEVRLDDLSAAVHGWYDPADAVDPDRAAALAAAPRERQAAALEEELRASVRRRLMADVPVGTMCSGGLDSSLVAAFAREEHPRIVAYNASVADQPAADEGPWAARVARALGVELRTARLTGAEWRAGLVAAVAHNEFPLIHESSVPMAMIAGLARGDGVKVLLSGEGADELFAGYDFLHAAEYRGLLPPAARARQRLELVRARADALRRRGGRGLWRGVRRRLERPAENRLTRPPAAPAAAEWAADVAARAAAACSHHSGARAALEAGLLGDLRLYLPHLLNRQDKNTMQESVETRVPFLDPGVVALALNLPIEARVLPLRKGVLRDLGRAHLPRAVARRAKVGFGFDVRRYLEPAARPEFLGAGVLREVLGFARDEWAGATTGLAPDQTLRAWTGEVWCRLFLEGRSVAEVEAELWR
jgi:asparagine synthase (glutamine-hydrolysing)